MKILPFFINKVNLIESDIPDNFKIINENIETDHDQYLLLVKILKNYKDDFKNNLVVKELIKYLMKNKIYFNYEDEYIVKKLVDNEPLKRILCLYLTSNNIKNENFNKFAASFLPETLGNIGKYDLTEEEIEHFLEKYQNLMYDKSFLKNNHVDAFNFIRFNKFDNLNSIRHIFQNKKKSIEYNNSYILNHRKIERIGIYIIDKRRSPAFNHYRKAISLLNEEFDLYLYLENNSEDLDVIDNQLFSNIEKKYFIKNMNDKELSDMIYNHKLTMLIFIYGLFFRPNVVYNHPAPILIHHLDPSALYPKEIFDFNLVDAHQCYTIKKKSNIEKKYFNFIYLKGFYSPPPYYSELPDFPKQNYITQKNIDNKDDKIRLGIIAYSSKFSLTSIKLLNEIVKLSPRILISIYAYDNKSWFDKVFPSDQIILDNYDHTNPRKLRDNILFLDSDKCNHHSTGLEIVRLKIPILAFQSDEYYIGNYTTSLMKVIHMDKYLVATSLEDYLKKIEKIILNPKWYNFISTRLYNKLNKYPVHKTEFYVKDLKNTLHEFYDKYYRKKVR